MTSLALACKLNAAQTLPSKVARMVAALRRIGGSLWMVDNAFSGSYIDITGTQPVTSIGDLLGLTTDRLGVLGAELMTDPSFDDPSKWSPGAGWSVTGGNAVATAAASNTNMVAAASGYAATVATKTYKAEVVIPSISGGVTLIIWNGSTNLATTSTITAPGTYSLIYTANNTQCRPYLSAQGASTTLAASSLSQKELTGSHATQSAVASKPSVQSVNGRTVISFDGSNDFLQTGITTGNEGWICAGVTPIQVTTAATVFNAGATSDASKGVWLYLNAGNWVFRVGNGTAREDPGAVTASAGVPVVVSGGWTASTVMLDKDGATVSAARSGDCTSPTAAIVGAITSGTIPFSGPMNAIAYAPVLPDAATRKIIRDGIAALQGRTL